MTDPFLGRWKLNPRDNQYEYGFAPQKGRYTMTWEDDHYLVKMAWINAEGKEVQMSYTTIPDGQPHSMEAAGDLVTTRVDERTLDSEVIINGEVVAFARRVLSPDGQRMTVTQSGMTPDGTPYSNLSVYDRIIE